MYKRQIFVLLIIYYFAFLNWVLEMGFVMVWLVVEVEVSLVPLTFLSLSCSDRSNFLVWLYLKYC